jgi:hypothetical protein
VRKLKEKKRGWLLLYVEYWMDAGGWYENGKYNFRGKVLYIEYIRGVTLVLAQTAWSGPEIRHTLDPSLLSLLVVPLVRELRSTRSCDFLNRGGGFIKGILRGVRCTKSLRVFFNCFIQKTGLWYVYTKTIKRRVFYFTLQAYVDDDIQGTVAWDGFLS